tara:strand:- start:436 stop:672 length:237 start_codon:yes stop_codon:yes gene_type:complete
MDKIIEALNKVADMFRAVTGAGLALVATAVIAQILFGADVPFLKLNVVSEIISITNQLGGEGLVGLASAGVLLALFKK